MFINQHVAKSAAARGTALASKLRRSSAAAAPPAGRTIDPRKLAHRQQLLARGGTQPSPTELERLMGTNDLVDEFYLERALLAGSPVARLSIRSLANSERGCATGFMISPRLLLTNAHVFPDADQAEPSLAEFNYRDDLRGDPLQSFRYRLRPGEFFFADAALDFAVVSVDPVSLDDARPLTDFGYHRLIAETGKIDPKEWMTIIQHPNGRRRQYAIRENQLRAITDDFLWYLSDTAQGSSGAPVFNDSFLVVALHHGGKARQQNGRYVLKNGRTVTSLVDVDDSEVDWVANEGVRVSRICQTLLTATEKGGHIAEFRTAMQGGDVLTRAYADSTRISNSLLGSSNSSVDTNTGAVRVPIVLDLQLNLSGRSIGTVTTQPILVGRTDINERPIISDNADALETAREPIVDKNYTKRRGFLTTFLGPTTSLPTVLDLKSVARMKNNAYVIRYEHFSLVMHKERRLALYTASNVDGRKGPRAPEPGHSYTRKELTGLGDNDLEKWLVDPRISAAHQLSDKFFNADRQSFDKGHVVRREDVCWGESFAQVQRANGDTFHVTNCSPQESGFNQSRLHGEWGLLENFVLTQAKAERYNLFSGPVLADDDRVFHGKDDQGEALVKIPRRFWKVVVATKAGKLQAFAFMLEQGLKTVAWEFAPTAEWKARMITLKELEKQIRLLRFPKALHAADQA